MDTQRQGRRQDLTDLEEVQAAINDAIDRLDLEAQFRAEGRKSWTSVDPEGNVTVRYPDSDADEASPGSSSVRRR